MVDAVGRVFEPGSQADRIVSLVPSATETLIALGGSSRLVGRTQYDTAATLAHLPSVGGGLDPSIEALVGLRPDLVVRFASEADPRTPDRLDALGIAHFAVRPERIEDATAMIRDLGQLIGAGSEARALLARIEADLAEVRSTVADHPPVRAAYLLDGTPTWAAGPGSFIHELIETGGGINVFSDLDRPYAPVSAEALLARDIEVVLTPEGSRPGDLPPSADVRSVSPLTQLPGPRLGDAAREIARALHPDVFR